MSRTAGICKDTKCYKDVYTEEEVNELLKEKSDSGHTHDDRYYTFEEVKKLLKEKSDSGHTHDDRYYTEKEMDTRLANKIDVSKFKRTSGKVALNKGIGNALLEYPLGYNLNNSVVISILKIDDNAKTYQPRIPYMYANMVSEGIRVIVSADESYVLTEINVEVVLHRID